MILLLSDWDCGSADVNLTRISDGATPLYVACQRAHLSCIRLLLLKGANINHKRKGGYTPLWTACDLGHQVKRILYITSHYSNSFYVIHIYIPCFPHFVFFIYMCVYVTVSPPKYIYRV